VSAASVKLSLLYPETRSVAEVRALAIGTEEAGFHGMWLGSGFGFDPIVALAVAGDATSSVNLGVAVVPTWPRHPVVMAQQAATASAATGGRFRLGVGPSHTPVMGMYGIPMDRPISHLREYLTILRTLLSSGSVSHAGERFQVTAFLDVADAPTPPVLLAVLRPQMARLAGGYSDGVLCWLTPAPYLHDVIAPNLADGAERAERPVPPMIAELPCALTADRDQVHEMAARELAMYTRMPFYRAMFEAAGLTVEGKTWSDEMVDAAIVYGDEDGLATRIRGLIDAGADEVVLSPFGIGDDPAASQRKCIQVLADIAKG
jgi:5,10-methylenetetrahydromethanopterin reductase